MGKCIERINAGEEDSIAFLITMNFDGKITDQRIAVEFNADYVEPKANCLKGKDFIARLVALVPRPRVNLTRYHGVFGSECGGDVRIIANIEDPAVINKILAHLDAITHPAGGRRLPQCRAPPSVGLIEAS